MPSADGEDGGLGRCRCAGVHPVVNGTAHAGTYLQSVVGSAFFSSVQCRDDLCVELVKVRHGLAVHFRSQDTGKPVCRKELGQRFGGCGNEASGCAPRLAVLRDPPEMACVEQPAILLGQFSATVQALVELHTVFVVEGECRKVLDSLYLCVVLGFVQYGFDVAHWIFLSV